ncbi:12442_t:CDS:1, partial [Cetraspora pellucida]
QMLSDSSLSKSKRNKQKKRQLSHEPETENELVEKQARVQHAYEIEVETCEIGVQVSKETCEVGVQVSDAMSYILENHIHLLQAQLNTKIDEIENLQKQLEYAYDYVIE